jgi:acyl carrier protein
MEASSPRLPELEGLLAKVLNVPRSEIAEDADQRSLLRWDSVTHIELITTIEKAYGVSFAITEIISMNSLKSIREQLRRKGVVV